MFCPVIHRLSRRTSSTTRSATPRVHRHWRRRTADAPRPIGARGGLAGHRLMPCIPTPPLPGVSEPDIATSVTCGRMTGIVELSGPDHPACSGRRRRPEGPPAAWVLEAVDDQSCIVDVGVHTPTCLPSIWAPATSTGRPIPLRAAESQPTSRLVLTALATQATLGLVAVDSARGRGWRYLKGYPQAALSAVVRGCAVSSRCHRRAPPAMSSRSTAAASSGSGGSQHSRRTKSGCSRFCTGSR